MRKLGSKDWILEDTKLEQQQRHRHNKKIHQKKASSVLISATLEYRTGSTNRV